MGRHFSTPSVVAALLLALGWVVPSPVHTHAGHDPVPVAHSEPCPGGGVHLHAARLHPSERCPACAAGPPAAAALPQPVSFAAAALLDLGLGLTQRPVNGLHTSPGRPRAPPVPSS